MAVVHWMDHLESTCCWVNQQLDMFHKIGNPEDAEEKALAEEIIKRLMDVNLCYVEVQISPLRLAVHPDNRWKSLLHTPHVHELLDDFVRIGWSASSQLGKAVCFEKLPGEAGKVQEQKNMILYRAADGLLGDVSKWCLEDADRMTVGSSHSAAACRLPLLCATATEITAKFAISNNRIASENIIARKPSMQEPLEKGMTFKVIRSAVELKCPRLPNFLQAAFNADHGVEKQQTPLQRMNQIHAMACANKSDPTIGHEDWDSISKQIASNARMQFEEVKAWSDFVQAWGGGEVPVTLIELERFSKIMKVDCGIPSAIWTAISKLSITKYPEYVVALIKAILTSPPALIHKGESKMFTTQDISNIASMSHQVKAACEFMKRARFFLTQSQNLRLSPAQLERLLGDLDSRLILHNHSKKIKGRMQFKNLAEVGTQFAVELKKLQGDLPDDCPWKATCDIEQPATNIKSMRNFSEQGIDLSVLANEGYKVGVTVCRKDPGEHNDLTWIISEINAVTNSIELQRSDDKEDKTKVNVASLLDDYKIFVIVEKVISDPIHKLWNPLGDDDAMIASKKAEFIAALRKLYVQHKNYELDLRVQSKPTKSLIANDAFRAQSIVLVPFSTNISAEVIGKKSPPFGSVTSGVLGHTRSDSEVNGVDESEFTGKPIAAIIQSRTQLLSSEDQKASNNKKEFVVPFWIVQTISDSLDANLVLKIYTVNGIDIRCLVNDKKSKREMRS